MPIASPVKACVWLAPAPDVTALFVTLCVSVALGPAVVPEATPPVGFPVSKLTDVELVSLPAVRPDATVVALPVLAPRNDVVV